MTNLNNSTAYFLVSFAVSSFCFHSNLHAQTNTSQSDTIERIIVTANRAPSTLLETPASVESINQDELALIGHQHISQALSRVSGTWISRGNGQEHLTAVRSPVLTGAGGCGAFFMAYDGISLRAPGFCNANQLFDANSEQASSIEVLKGPASTLYGSNALHGVINIIPPKAFSNEENYLDLRLGRDDHVKTSLGYRVQRGESAFGLFTNLTQNNGYQKDSGYDQQKISSVYEYNGPIWQNKSLLDFSNLNQETAGFIAGFRAFEDDQIRVSNPNPEAFRDAKSVRASSKFSREVAEGTLSFTPFARWNEMTFLQHYLPWKALETNRHQSIGLQAQYRYVSNKVTLITGIDSDFTNANLKETQEQDFSPSIPSGEHYNYDVDATQIGAFVNAQWLIDDVVIAVGGRIEHIDYDYDNLLSSGSACDESVATCRFSRPADQRVDFTVFSPSFSVLYSLDKQQTVYGRLSQGFRAPQATELFRLQNNQLITDIEEEKMDALEFGWRFETNDVMTNASVFYQEKSNFIFQDTQRQNIADGETKHRGVEVSVKYNISRTLYLNANATYAKHNYQNDLSLSRVSIQGNEIDTAPKTLGSIQIGWQIKPDLLTELSWQHLGNYYLNPENTAEYAGHNLVDLNIRYKYSPQLSFSANVYNVLDEDYAERADFGFGSYRYFVGQPRRLFVSARWFWSQ